MTGSVTARRGGDWVVMIPVKPFALGKSRLADDAAGRAEVARAIALDTVDAVLAVGAVRRVVVVTADEDVVHVLPAGVEVVRERRAAGID
ncbi:MAG: 2-phospho-L-lactate guanylyltransferase, partial [Microbacterium sp.]